METTLIIILVVMAGFVIGKYSSQPGLLKMNDLIVSILLYLLLFVFGINFGLHKEMLDKIGQLGWEITILTLGGIIGSSILAGIMGSRFIRIDKNEK